MPEMCYYMVTQTREVKVWANTPIDAARIGDLTFHNDVVSGIVGAAISEIRDVDISVKKDRDV